MTLDKLPVGQTRRIAAVGGQGALRRRLLDMGLTPKTQVTVQKVAPMGDPIELRLRGYELTLRLDDAREIALEAPDGAASEPLVLSAVLPQPAKHSSSIAAASSAARIFLVFIIFSSCEKSKPMFWI